MLAIFFSLIVLIKDSGCSDEITFVLIVWELKIGAYNIAIYIFQIQYMSLNIALSCALRVSWFCALGSLQNILLSRGCRFCRIQRTLWWGKKPENGPNGYFTASMHWQMFRESPLSKWKETNTSRPWCQKIELSTSCFVAKALWRSL